MPNVGYVAITLALALAVYAAVVAVIGTQRGVAESSERATAQAKMPATVAPAK